MEFHFHMLLIHVELNDVVHHVLNNYDIDLNYLHHQVMPVENILILILKSLHHLKENILYVNEVEDEGKSTLSKYPRFFYINI